MPISMYSCPQTGCINSKTLTPDQAEEALFFGSLLFGFAVSRKIDPAAVGSQPRLDMFFPALAIFDQKIDVLGCAVVQLVPAQ